MVGGIRNRKLKGQARSALALLAFMAACFGAALVGSAFTAPSVPVWYEGLVKPSFTPPSWLFVPYLAWVSFASILNFEIWRLNS
jgi:tryptophan-rich sensory protein